MEFTRPHRVEVKDSVSFTEEETAGSMGNRDEETGLTTGQVQGTRQSIVPLVLRLGFSLLVGIFIGLVIGYRNASSKSGGGADGGSLKWNGTGLSWDQKLPLNFLAVGDWGREGAYNQTMVADAMAVVSNALGSNFVISTGDNFYERGLASVDDPLFNSSFTNVYRHESLQTQWYAVLGNHDYKSDPDVQVSRELAKRDMRWRCQKAFQLQFSVCPDEAVNECTDELELFFIDTNPFVEKYWHELNFTGLPPKEQALPEQVKNLEIALNNSTATWKIVVGHHPVRSVGDHGDTPNLVSMVLPLLEKYNVDLYLNGHDHCLQHIKRSDSPVTFVTTGAGSKAYRPQKEATPEEGVQFDYNGQGFVSLSIGPKKLDLYFYNVFATMIHELHLSK